MFEYHSFTCLPAQLTEKCNKIAERGFRVCELRIQGNHIYVLMEKAPEGSCCCCKDEELIPPKEDFLSAEE